MAYESQHLLISMRDWKILVAWCEERGVEPSFDQYIECFMAGRFYRKPQP